MTNEIAHQIADRLFTAPNGDQADALMLTRLRSELELENMGGWRKQDVVAVILALSEDNLAASLTDCEIDELKEMLEDSNPVFRERIINAISQKPLRTNTSASDGVV